MLLLAIYQIRQKAFLDDGKNIFPKLKTKYIEETDS